MFLQGSLLLSVVVCLVTCLPQPLSNVLPNALPNVLPNALPNVDAQIPAVPGGWLIKVAEYLGLTPKLPSVDNLPLPNGVINVPDAIANKSSLPNTGLPGVPAAPAQSDLEQRIARLEAVLKLEGMIQEVGKKIIATSRKEVDFETSVANCKNAGGKIATPMNEEENNAILSFVKKYNRYAYLGIKEGAVPNTFQYMNGIPAVYTHWGKNEPSSKGNENCVEMYTDGTWNDKGCNQNRLTICEF